MNNYITLLKSCLTDLHRVGQIEYKPIYSTTWKMRILEVFDRWLRKYDFAITKVVRSNYEDRINGRDWPAHADTMIGMKRLDNIEKCMRSIIEREIPGDFIECGVWRGGACIFMNGFLNHVQSNRRVWLADSFEGLPKPEHEKDNGDKHYTRKELCVTDSEVKKRFEAYGMDPTECYFLKGWFNNTLPRIPDRIKFALIRLDGDMYGSTWDCLTNLYPKLSVGGYCIIDDWNLKGARQAVEDYREQLGITDEIVDIDGWGKYWRKTK